MTQDDGRPRKRLLRGVRRYAYSHPMTNTYRTAEAAKLLGVHPSTLRRWDKTGILRPSIRTPTGERRYTEADLEAGRKTPAA